MVLDREDGPPVVAMAESPSAERLSTIMSQTRWFAVTMTPTAVRMVNMRYVVEVNIDPADDTVPS